MNVTLRFGASAVSWPVSSTDFIFQKMGNTCVGAFIAIDTSIGSSVPPWIVGDTFLKNVYSVFRASPPSVGFAQLSETALAMNGVTGPAPSPTIGEIAATVTGSTAGTGSDRNTGSNGAARVEIAGVWVSALLTGLLGANLLL